MGSGGPEESEGLPKRSDEGNEDDAVDDDDDECEVDGEGEFELGIPEK